MRLHGAISFDGNARELRQLEIGAAELFQEANDVVGLRAGHVEVLDAEFLPVVGVAFVNAVIADVAQGLGLGGGTASRSHAIGVDLTFQAAQEEIAHRGDDMRIRWSVEHKILSISGSK
jgi:hypothetical protein